MLPICQKLQNRGAESPPGGRCRLHGLAGRSARRHRRRAGRSSCQALHDDFKIAQAGRKGPCYPIQSSCAASSTCMLVPQPSLVQLQDQVLKVVAAQKPDRSTLREYGVPSSQGPGSRRGRRCRPLCSLGELHRTQ